MGSRLQGACIIGQSGGPTAVINASAYGVIRTALDSPDITRVLGAAHGIRGVLDDKLYDMGMEDAYELSLLLGTPSSELGSVRYKIADPEKDDTDMLFAARQALARGAQRCHLYGGTGGRPFGKGRVGRGYESRRAGQRNIHKVL